MVNRLAKFLAVTVLTATALLAVSTAPAHASVSAERLRPAIGGQDCVGDAINFRLIAGGSNCYGGSNGWLGTNFASHWMTAGKYWGEFYVETVSGCYMIAFRSGDQIRIPDGGGVVGSVEITGADY
jgi:hypothetical protein